MIDEEASKVVEKSLYSSFMCDVTLPARHIPTTNKVMREDREDGEFWMEIDDFVRYFSKIELCNLSTSRIEDDDHAQMNWITTIHEVSGFLTFAFFV